MTQKSHTRFLRGLASLLALAAGACSEPTVSHDYRINHPVTVRQEGVRLALKAPLSPDSLGIEDQMRLVRFLDHYRAKGVGAIRVQAQGSGSYEGGAWMDGARQLLLKGGLQPNQILLAGDGVADDGGQPMVLLSFTGNAVDVPTCGKAAFNYGFNPNNLPVADFGCSMQRNIGLMVENPGDLLQARPVSDRDPTRTLNVITDYRTGAATPSTKSVEQQSGFMGSEGTGRAGSGGGTNVSPVTKGTDQSTPVPAPVPTPSPAPTTGN